MFEEFYREATVWVDGLDKVDKQRGINFCRFFYRCAGVPAFDVGFDDRGWLDNAKGCHPGECRAPQHIGRSEAFA